jgi:hypothetical protein
MEQFVNELTNNLVVVLEVVGEDVKWVSDFRKVLQSATPLQMALTISLIHKYWCHVTGVQGYMIDGNAMEFMGTDTVSKLFELSPVPRHTRAMYEDHYDKADKRRKFKPRHTIQWDRKDRPTHD